MCALVIKLFSPNIKYRSTVPASTQQSTPFDKPYFPISMRLLRVVSILIQKYHSLLVSKYYISLNNETDTVITEQKSLLFLFIHKLRSA